MRMGRVRNWCHGELIRIRNAFYDFLQIICCFVSKIKGLFSTWAQLLQELMLFQSSSFGLINSLNLWNTQPKTAGLRATSCSRNTILTSFLGIHPVTFSWDGFRKEQTINRFVLCTNTWTINHFFFFLNSKSIFLISFSFSYQIEGNFIEFSRRTLTQREIAFCSNEQIIFMSNFSTPKPLKD